MAILDAQDMTLISEVEAPIVTPIGVHNRWKCHDMVLSFLYNSEINCINEEPLSMGIW